MSAMTPMAAVEFTALSASDFRLASMAMVLLGRQPPIMSCRTAIMVTGTHMGEATNMAMAMAGNPTNMVMATDDPRARAMTAGAADVTSLKMA